MYFTLIQISLTFSLFLSTFLLVMLLSSIFCSFFTWLNFFSGEEGWGGVDGLGWVGGK